MLTRYYIFGLMLGMGTGIALPIQPPISALMGATLILGGIIYYLAFINDRT